MNITRFLMMTLICCVLIVCAKEEPVKLRGSVFGTTYSIIYYSTTNYEIEIDNLFTKVNTSLSTYMYTSDISRINRGEKNIIADSLFKEVFQKSARIYKETDGYFDPTVGILVNAWGFGPKKPLNNIDTAKISDLMKFVGFNKVRIENDTVVKKYKEIYFDFNSIAKGYGIDIVGRFLESKGIKNYMVEIGGEVRVRGMKPGSQLWKVEIENPNTDGSRNAYTRLELTDKTVASSGNYRKYRITEDGQKYVHTINPKTGYATESNLLAATVITGLDCADADAYATAFMAMGLEKTTAFLERKPALKVILIYVDDKGTLKAWTSNSGG
ncbi:MAG: FAD:protein FMN transferase [Flavobacteriaceae bacterium]|nr:MAG: FAD:protein FMN transferase [Flavobacteriaceae bacterium]